LIRLVRRTFLLNLFRGSVKRCKLPAVVIQDGFDFTDPDLYAQRLPLAEFAELRRTAPVWWNAQPHGSAGFDDDGFWAVTRHADRERGVAQTASCFSAAENAAIIRHGPADGPGHSKPACG